MLSLGVKMIWKILVTVLVIFCSGCIPFISDEQQTALWMSQEERIESFKRYLDFQLGKEFNTPVQKAEWCKTHRCLEISDSVTEYIEEFINKKAPSRKCVVAWKVDSKQSGGNYQYGKGPLFYGLGKRLSWRYVSRPEDCLTTISFWGPY